MSEPTPFGEYLDRQEFAREILETNRIRDLAALLDLDLDALAPGGHLLPPLGHWVYFDRWPRESELGPDGHRRRGSFMPPVTLPRRMFAGGRVTFHQPLYLEGVAERVASIASIRAKTGVSGQLLFVTVRYEVFGRDGLAIEEEQDIVYAGEREATPSPASQPAEAVSEPSESARFCRTIWPDPVLLFRFSALTSNSHRIHYDRQYATEVEGYPGLVVHGSLQAMLLMDLVREYFPLEIVTRFSFRSRKPLFDTDQFECVARPADSGVELLTRDQDGATCMTALASFD
jgi:3-methylfumaryl-CoA hydratase